MSKMTTELIEDLYSLGKRVYSKDLTMKDAVGKIMDQYDTAIAESSAEFYIGLVKELISGKGSTWNQNSDLLVYYVDHISSEYGMEAGNNAYKGGMAFAKSKSRKALISELEKVKEKHHLDGAPAFNNTGDSDMNELNQQVNHIIEYIKSSGFMYDDGLIENFYLCLKSKPFVLLAGTSGTGKTKLVKLFAEAIGAEYKLVSVRPDWSDSSDLFGHKNLRGDFVPGAIIDYIVEAKSHLDTPYILCLDEMNLARVEHYFSDYLSIIETRRFNNGEIITSQISTGAEDEKYKNIYLPENLYLVGTVNMDETTYPFSKKVLDRANTIEFSDVNLIPSFENKISDVSPIKLGNSFLKTKYITLLSDTAESQEALVTQICTELEAFNLKLKKANAHVGYRVRDEIVFYMLNNDEFKLLEYEDAMDFEIMQKILPRIQGSSGGIKDLLEDLFKKCAGDYSSFSQDQIWMQMRDYLNKNGAIYMRSAEKVCYMMRRFEEDGFTSYWL
ncbi:McrB family protein [Butyrivibrio proteoclasticus]|uniref:McrB family protein n=1 Tax=Butyrivibrio proteoclasticus TaxID=43305 RepID=UPI00068751D4|nr:AAA family ATPase [Butyrivibrio proteoclasticus]